MVKTLQLLALCVCVCFHSIRRRLSAASPFDYRHLEHNEGSCCSFQMLFCLLQNVIFELKSLLYTSYYSYYNPADCFLDPFFNFFGRIIGILGYVSHLYVYMYLVT